MNGFWRIIGLAAVFIAVYQLWKHCRINERISNNSLFLGVIASFLLIEAIDKLTIGYLYSCFGKICYNRFIGFWIDIMLVGIMFRKPNEELTQREVLWARIQGVLSIAIFSWYFMYYLCK